MSETVTAFDSADAARRCPVPALIVQARHPFTDPESLASLGDNWHRAQVVGAGHFLQLLVPDQVNAMVLRFLELADS
jgi:pimeloyl-ACP methyl ester carboxylesterase